MNTTIKNIQLGFDTCYLVQMERGACFLIDAGQSGWAKAFPKSLDRFGVDPEQIILVIVTHAHWDHIGCLKSIKELTGSKVVAHVAEREWIEKGQSVNPRGITLWGKTLSRLVDLFLPFVSIPSTSVDIAIDHELSLEPFGLNGRVMHTPGHSPGSLSVLLSTGEAFVGDLAMNRLPLTIGPRLPIFGDDLKAVATSWRRLIDAGAREIFPAHGKPFSVDLIRKSLDALDH